MRILKSQPIWSSLYLLFRVLVWMVSLLPMEIDWWYSVLQIWRERLSELVQMVYWVVWMWVVVLTWYLAIWLMQLLSLWWLLSILMWFLVLVLSMLCLNSLWNLNFLVVWFLRLMDVFKVLLLLLLLLPIMWWLLGMRKEVVQPL